MDFHGKTRKELQDLCKKHGIPANLKNVEMANRLDLLFKEKEKGKIEGDSSFVDVVETDSEIDLKFEKLKKKVTFSPENETFIFVGTDTGSDTDQDGKSKKKRKKVAKGKKVQGNPVRATRSRGQRLDQGDVEEVSLPLGKRTRGRKAKESAYVSVAEMGERDPPENSKGELVSRQLISRKVDGEAGSKAGDEDLPVSQKKRTVKGLNISTTVQLDDPPRRTRRNTESCFASTANGQSTTHEDEVKMKPSREAPLDKGANAAKRRQSVRFASVEQSTTHEDEVKVMPSREAPLEKGSNAGKRRKSVRFASVEQSSTHEDEVKMMPREAPLEKGANAAKRRQSVRFASVEQSSTHEDEVKMMPREAPLEKVANAAKRRQSVRFASVEQSTTHEDEVEMKASREAPLEKGANVAKRRQTVRVASVEQSTIHEDEKRVKPSREAPSEVNVNKRRQSVWVKISGETSVKVGEVAVAKNDRRTKKRRETILIEEIPEIVREPVQEKPKRQSTRNAAKSKVKLTELSGKAAKKTKRGRLSKVVEEDSFTESTLLPEEAPVTDVELAQPEAPGSKTVLDLGSPEVIERSGEEMNDFSKMNAKTSQPGPVHASAASKEVVDMTLNLDVEVSASAKSPSISTFERAHDSGVVVNEKDYNIEEEGKSIEGDANDAVELASPEQVECPNKLNIQGSSSKCQADSAGKPSHLVGYSDGFETEESQKGQSMNLVGCDVEGELAEHDKALEDQSLVELNASGKSNPVIEDPILQDKPSEFSESQDMDINLENPAEEAEQICFSVPNDMERVISQVDDIGPIGTERVEETPLPGNTSAFTSEFSPQIRDGSQIEAQNISHCTVDGSSDISEVQREMDSNFEMEIPDSSAFSGQTYFFEGQVGDYERTGEGRTTEENKSEDALNNEPASDIQEITHEGSEGNLVLDGGVLSILDKTDGQVGEDEQQEVSDGSYDKVPPEPLENYSHESSPVTQDERRTNGDGYDPTTVVSKYDKARESSVRMNLDDEFESDAVKWEEEAMLLPNFILENEEQGKDYKSQDDKARESSVRMNLDDELESDAVKREEEAMLLPNFILENEEQGKEYKSHDDKARESSVRMNLDDELERDAVKREEEAMLLPNCILENEQQGKEYKSQDDKARESSVRMNLDDELESDAVKREEEAMLLPDFILENEQQRKEYKSQGTSNEICLEVCGHMEVSDESVQTMTQFQQVKSGEHDTQEDAAVDLIESASFVANDLISRDAEANTPDNVEEMNIGLNSIDESLKAEMADDFVVYSEDTSGDNLLGKESLDINVSDHDVTLNYAHEDISVPLEKGENTDGDVGNSMKRDEKYSAEVISLVDISFEKSEACLSPVIGLAHNVCSFPGDNVTTERKSSAHKNDEYSSDATNGSNQEGDAFTQEFAEVLFDGHKGEGALVDAAFVDRADSMISSQIEKTSSSHVPDDKPVARDDIKEVGMSENFSLLSSWGSEMDVSASCLSPLRSALNVYSPGDNVTTKSNSSAHENIDDSLGSMDVHRVVSSPLTASCLSPVLGFANNVCSPVDNATTKCKSSAHENNEDFSDATNGSDQESEDATTQEFVEVLFDDHKVSVEDVAFIDRANFVTSNRIKEASGSHAPDEKPIARDDIKEVGMAENTSLLSSLDSETDVHRVVSSPVSASAGSVNCFTPLTLTGCINMRSSNGGEVEDGGEDNTTHAMTCEGTQTQADNGSKVEDEELCGFLEANLESENTETYMEVEENLIMIEQFDRDFEMQHGENQNRTNSAVSEDGKNSFKQDTVSVKKKAEDEGSKVAGEQRRDVAEVVMEEAIREEEVLGVAAEQCCDEAQAAVLEEVIREEVSKVAAEQCCDVAEVAVLEEAIHEDEVPKVAAEQCCDVAEAAALEDASREDECSKVVAEQRCDTAEVVVMEETIHEDEVSKVAAEQCCDVAEVAVMEVIREDEVSKVAAEQCCDVAEVAVLEEAIHEDEVSKVAAEQCDDVAEVAVFEEAIHEDEGSKVAAEQICDIAEVVMEEAIHEDEVSKVAAEQHCDVDEVAVSEEAIHEDEVSKVAAELCNDVTEVAVSKEAIHEDEGSKVAAEQICDIAEAVVEEAICEDEVSKVAAEQCCDIAEVAVMDSIREDEVSKIAVLEAIHEDEGSKVAAEQRCDVDEVILEKPIHVDEDSKVAAEQGCVAEVSVLEDPVIHEDEGSIEEGNLSVINQGCVDLEYHKNELAEMENSREATEITDSNSAAFCGGDDSKPEKFYGETMELCEDVSELNATVVNAASDEPFSSNGVKEEINKASFTVQEFANDSSLEFKNSSETSEINGGNSASSGEPSAECGANDLKKVENSVNLDIIEGTELSDKGDQVEDIAETEDPSMDPSEPITPFMKKFPALGSAAVASEDARTCPPKMEPRQENNRQANLLKFTCQTAMPRKKNNNIFIPTTPKNLQKPSEKKENMSTTKHVDNITATKRTVQRQPLRDLKKI